MQSRIVSAVMSAITRPRYLLFVFLLVTIPLMDILLNTESGIVENVPFGASFLTYLILLGRATLAVLALHWLITFIFDSVKLDIVKMVEAHPEHNGLYMIAISVFALAFAIIIQAVVGL